MEAHKYMQLLTVLTATYLPVLFYVICPGNSNALNDVQGSFLSECTDYVIAPGSACKSAPGTHVSFARWRP